MSLFSVGVKTTNKFPAGSNLFSMRSAKKAYIVEAQTDRKAKNAVDRYLKSIGEEDAFEILYAIPAEHLPDFQRATKL